jgi:hypothetical protein
MASRSRPRTARPSAWVPVFRVDIYDRYQESLGLGTVHLATVWSDGRSGFVDAADGEHAAVIRTLFSRPLIVELPAGPVRDDVQPTSRVELQPFAEVTLLHLCEHELGLRNLRGDFLRLG